MTKIYGVSDDLIEFEGDVRGEVGCYSTDENKHGALTISSDGTLLEVKYGKAGNLAIWEITLIKGGSLFETIDLCVDEDATPYSDVARFQDGLKWAYVATEWQRAK